VSTIITEIANNFIKNILEIFNEGGSLTEIEPKMLSESKKCAAEMFEKYAEEVDTAIACDKVARKKAGFTVERRNDERKVQTLVGEVCFNRTYYKKASGGYEYLTDTILGIDRRERVSEGLSLSLASAATDMSYWKATKHITDGLISRQTVMSRVRRGEAVVSVPSEKNRVPELHIDADEAHVTLLNGIKSEVPLISVYEGIETQGKRNKCREVFHISEYGKKPDDLWEQALNEIEARYDLTDTKIYLHGDGANWIKTGLEWIPNAIFVLDKYHKNKAIKAMTAGLSKEDRKDFDKEIRWALENEEIDFFNGLTNSLCEENPERERKILTNARYLKNFISGISICKTDFRANNGGCTEPHVSHVLSARLSSRPMAWSKKTLKKLAPVLAAGNISFSKREKNKIIELPASIRKATNRAKKAFNSHIKGLPSPDSIGVLPISGKITGTQILLKSYL